jgi:hypothetical protein
MKNQKGFFEYLKRRPGDSESIPAILRNVQHFLKNVSLTGENQEKKESLKAYLQKHVAGKPEAFLKIVSIVRYMSFAGEKDLLAYILTLVGTGGVLESIRRSAAESAGEEAAKKIFENIVPLPTGTPYEHYPPLVERLMSQLMCQVNEETAGQIMAGNHHGIPDESKWPERERFVAMGRDIDAYLKDYHARKGDELEMCRREDRLWYETVITSEVVAFVRDNPEVLGGVRKGKEIFVTKFPFDASAYLKETDPLLKRFYACHCGFVRSSIVEASASVPVLWCMCSGGFNKHLFDVIFEKQTKVRVLESVLKGDSRCHFAITIP